jgi:hypothetical protein
VEKPATEFYKRKKDSHLLVSRCIPCHRLASKAYEKAWYEANAEKKQAANAQWRAENPGKHAEKNRAWNEANREHRNALARERDRHRNLELARSHHAKWRAANKHQVRVNRAAYEATKLQATPAWGDAEKIAEFYFAADFLNMVTGEWHHVDHIVPLRSKRVCGLHAEHNMQVLTAKENLSKGNRRWPDMP